MTEHTDDPDKTVLSDEETHSASSESDRKEEVPALLGMSPEVHDDVPENISETENLDESVSDAVLEPIGVDDSAELAVVKEMPEPVVAEDSSDMSVSVEEVVGVPPDPAPAVLDDIAHDIIDIKQSLFRSLAETDSILSKIDEIARDVTGLSQKVADLTLRYDSHAEEMSASVSDAGTRSFLSKTFLTCASIIILLLASFQIYTFVQLVRDERSQKTSSLAVIDTFNKLNSKMAAYDKNITKILESPAQPKQESAEHAAHEAPVVGGGAPVPVIPVRERLNKLRNGLPEKKLFRKETGDWFVYSKKNDECIADVDIIEVLNQAYKKSGRPISTPVPLPNHKVLCLLKPDGKGGTQVVMTHEFLP